MATYIGKRVVPIVCGNWDINTPYEMLSIVLDTATKHSYISRREVPAGIAITNTEYWSLWTVALETAAIAPEMAAEKPYPVAGRALPGGSREALRPGCGTYRAKQGIPGRENHSDLRPCAWRTIPGRPVTAPRRRGKALCLSAQSAPHGPG